MNHLVGLVLILLVSLAVLSVVVFVATNPMIAMGKAKKSSDSDSDNGNNGIIAHTSKITLLAPLQAQSNQTTTTKSISIEGFNANNIRDVMHSEYKTGLILQLHNASKTKQEQSTIKYSLFNCIKNIVDPDRTVFLSAQLSLCDSSVTNMIVNHALGNNQTMIKAAYAYLKSRGIQ